MSSYKNAASASTLAYQEKERKKVQSQARNIINISASNVEKYNEIRKATRDFEQKDRQFLEGLEEVGTAADCTVNGTGLHATSDNVAQQSAAVRKNRQLQNFYRRSPWNPYAIAKSSKSILRHVNNKGEDIPGLTKPFIYVGTIFSTFAWHTEDHHLYSLNYHHFGAEKVWYGVPPWQSDLFEKALQKELHPRHAAHDNYIYELTTVMSPEKLKRHGLSVHTAIQREGEFIVTFPRAYHSGFNCGFNCAEAVNFACDDWLSCGWRALTEYRRNSRPVSFSMELLLISIVCNTFRKLSHQYNRGLSKRRKYGPNAISETEKQVGSNSEALDHGCFWVLDIEDGIQRENTEHDLQDDHLSRLATAYDVTANDRLENWAVILQATEMLKQVSNVQTEMFKAADHMNSIWLKPRLGDISGDLDDVDCMICKRELFLSGVTCNICKSHSCGLHAFDVCGCKEDYNCPEAPQTFIYRMTPSEISRLSEVVAAAAKYHMRHNVHEIQKWFGPGERKPPAMPTVEIGQLQ